MTSPPTISLRRRLKHAVAAGCGRALRASGAGGRYFAAHLPIVFYHGIWPAGTPALTHFGGIDLDQLRRELTMLAAHFDLVGLEQLLRCDGDDRAKARPRLAVCFDDGCDMMRTGAIDVLDSLGVPATMFVITACIDNRHLMWIHKLQAIAATHGAERLLRAYNGLMAKTGAGPQIGPADDLTAAVWCWPMERKEEYVEVLYRDCDMPPIEAYLDQHRPYMTTDELRAWLDRGHAIGLHTHSHPFCDHIATAELETEIVAPAAWLRRTFAIDFLPFAYPFGNRLADEHEAQVAGAAALACMLGVAGVSRRGTDPRRLERVSAEDGLDRSLFGKPALESLLEAAARRPRPAPPLAVRYGQPWRPLDPAGAGHQAAAAERGDR